MRTFATLCCFALLAACGSDDSNPPGAAAGDDGSDTDEPVVVTTVSPITSIAANVIGDRAEIVGVVPEGTNSHTFEPSPSVAETLSGADVVFVNGLQLEEPTLEVAREVAADATIVELGNEVVSPDEYVYDFSFPEDEGKPNPHLWTDPTLVKEYAAIVAETMSEVDPEGAGTYEANRAAFEEIVDELDAAIIEAFDTIEPEDRKLLTYHDAYGYFADTYGWTVVGAVQPSDFEEPSARDVAELIDQIEEEDVPAVFGSEVFPSPVLEQVAAETGATYYDDLRDDDLPGQPGEPEHSWLGLMKFNFVTMTEALGGDASAIEAVEVRNAVPDGAVYPQ